MTMQQNLDSILSQAVSDGAIPGVVAGVTDADEDLYLSGFGERVIGSGDEMTADTVGWIASMTKAVTGTAAMQLVEQGRLDLDAPVSDVLPILGDVRVLDGFDDDGSPRTRAPQRAITLRQLMTHTAGFSYEIWNGDIIRYQEATETPGIISCLDAALKTPLLFDPGDAWDYGINIDWVGKMVEEVSGQRLGAYFQQNIFQPLGMTDTAFRITDSMRSRLAKIHHRMEDGSLAPDVELEIPQEPEFEMGGGGLYGTVGDYMRFIRMILNHGSVGNEQVLRRETVEMMSRNQMGDLLVRELKTAIPPFSHDAEFFPGMSKSWGLSFMINNEDAPTGRPAGSLAWAGLANSFFWIDPKNAIGGVYLTQVLPFVDVKSFPLYITFETATYESLN